MVMVMTTMWEMVMMMAKKITRMMWEMMQEMVMMMTKKITRMMWEMVTGALKGGTKRSIMGADCTPLHHQAGLW